MSSSCQWVRFLLCPTDLRTGDRVLTPSRRFETVTAIEAGERYARCTRVTTVDTGPDFPWSLVNRRAVTVLRPAVA